MKRKGLSRRSEHGVTLVELLVAAAISVAIAGVLGTAFYQFFVVTNQGSGVVSALHQVQNAGRWLARDGQMASSASVGSDLELVVPDSGTVTYAVSGTDLVRTEGESIIRVARHVSSIDFYVDGRVVTMNISAAPEGHWDISEQATYKVCLRPEESG